MFRQREKKKKREKSEKINEEEKGVKTVSEKRNTGTAEDKERKKKSGDKCRYQWSGLTDPRGQHERQHTGRERPTRGNESATEIPCSWV